MKPCAARAARAADALEPFRERFRGQAALVLASGPSLEDMWAGRRTDLPRIVVNDAWRVDPGADILYACDAKWWMNHPAARTFAGLKVTYEANAFPDLVAVQPSGTDGEGFDERLGWMRHGGNSGHAAVHLAAQLGAARIVLVGFDMRKVNGRSHFFGEHPVQLRMMTNYETLVRKFRPLAEALRHRGIEVLNATPGSALKWFDEVDLDRIVPRTGEAA